MAKLTLSALTSSYRSNSALNANFDAIEAAVENTLSRDGTAPNAMGVNLDMSSYRVINAGTPIADSDLATKAYTDALVGAGNVDETALKIINDLSDLNNPIVARSNLGLGDAAVATIGSGVQAYDANLTSFLSANNLPTGTGTVDYVLRTDGAGTLTWVAQTGGGGGGDLVAANNLSDLVNASTARSNLSLVIGTDVFAYDANLQSMVNTFVLPTVDGAANTVLKTDGAGNLALATLASVGGMLTANNLSDVAVAATARTNLGVAIASDVQAYDANLTAHVGAFTMATVDGTSGQFMKTDGAGNLTFASIAGGGDMVAANNLSDVVSASTSRTNLGLVIGTDVQAQDANLATFVSNPLTAAELGELQNIGATTLSAAQWGFLGGTTTFGGSLMDDANAAAGRTTLGVVIGTDVLAHDANLASHVSTFTMATSDGTNGQFMQTDGSGNLTFASIAGGGDLLASNNLSDLDTAATGRTNLGVAIGSDVQAHSANLTSFLGALALPTVDGTANQVIKTDGAGNLDFVNAGAGDLVSTNNLSDLDTAATARTNLGVAIGSDVQAHSANLTSFLSALALPVADGTANQVIKTDGAGNLDFVAAGAGDLVAANNLSDVANVTTSQQNLSLEPAVDVMAYDDNLQGFVDIMTYPGSDGTSGQALITDGAGTLAFLDVESPVITVESHGAVGDGTTDDTTAIQAALTAANTAGGGVVQFAANTYVTGNLTIYGNTTMRGLGANATKLLAVAGRDANTNLITSHHGATAVTTASPTAITKAKPGVFTDTSHGLSNGDIVGVTGIGGMVELNNRVFIVQEETTNTFELRDYFTGLQVDTTNYTAFTSGGTVVHGNAGGEHLYNAITGIVSRSISDITIEDLTIDGNKSNNPYPRWLQVPTTNNTGAAIVDPEEDHVANGGAIGSTNANYIDNTDYLVDDGTGSGALTLITTTMPLTDSQDETDTSTYGAARRLNITSNGGDNSGLTFAVVGTTYTGAESIAATETITGPGASLVVDGDVWFTSITSITPSGTIVGGSGVDVGIEAYDAGSSASHGRRNTYMYSDNLSGSNFVSGALISMDRVKRPTVQRCSLINHEGRGIDDLGSKDGRYTHNYFNGITKDDGPIWCIYVARYGSFSSTALTSANNGNEVRVTTTATHGLTEGAEVRIKGVSGMTEINDRTFTILNAGGTIFDLADEDGTLYTAGTGGTAQSWGTFSAPSENTYVAHNVAHDIERGFAIFTPSGGGTIEHNHIHNFGEGGIYCGPTTNENGGLLNITGNTIRHGHMTDLVCNGIELAGQQNIHIRGNHFEDIDESAIVLTGLIGGSVEDNTFKNCATAKSGTMPYGPYSERYGFNIGAALLAGTAMARTDWGYVRIGTLSSIGMDNVSIRRNLFIEQANAAPYPYYFQRTKSGSSSVSNNTWIEDNRFIDNGSVPLFDTTITTVFVNDELWPMFRNNGTLSDPGFKVVAAATRTAHDLVTTTLGAESLHVYNTSSSHIELSNAVGTHGWNMNINGGTGDLRFTRIGSVGDYVFSSGSIRPNDAFGLPTSAGTSGQVMESTGSGKMVWATPAAGGASELDDLSDVTITTGSNGDYLQHNGSAWVDAPISLAISDCSDVDTTGVATTNLLTWNGSNWVDTSAPQVAKIGLGMAAGSSLINILAGGSNQIHIDNGTESWGININGGNGDLRMSRTGGSGVFDVNTAINTTGFYEVDGTQVVGNQGAAVADATDAASAITQLNLVIARMEAHGLIA